MTPDEQEQPIAAAELERLRRIEEAAKKLLVQMEGRKSPSERLAALAELRAALRQERW
jgi:hypothetical protein